MHLLHHLRLRDHQIVVAPYQVLAAKVGGAQVVALQGGAHGAVEDEDAALEGGEVGKSDSSA